MKEIEKLLKSVKIEGVISDFVELKPAGKNLMGLCPFHEEKTPSFTVSPSKQIYHCFGCHEGGNVWRFLTKFHKISHIDALIMLKKYSKISLKLDKLEELTEYVGLCVNALGEITKPEKKN